MYDTILNELYTKFKPFDISLFSDPDEWYISQDNAFVNSGSVLKLSNAEIVDPKKITATTIVFSATVKLYEFEKETEIIYTIVGDDEADIKLGLISFTSSFTPKEK